MSNGKRVASALRVLVLLGWAASTVACQNVAFYEKEALAHATMKAEADRGETHFRQKVQYSREAAIGGIGDTAGGGCGCY